MSVSSLPEWKQLLLERKRREEEERERREKVEEDKLANMPAWKRGIIQRRRAKQDVSGDKEREKERESFLLSPSDGQSDTDGFVAARLGCDPLFGPDPGLCWLDGVPKPRQSQVSVETIAPLHENPFIRTQSGWRRGVGTEKAGQMEKGMEQSGEPQKEKKLEKFRDRSRGREREQNNGKLEKFRDRSRGREREQNNGNSDGREKERESETNGAGEREKGRDGDQAKERERKREGSRSRERECLRVRKEEEEEREGERELFAPLVSGLRTIRAENIIIIEQGRKTVYDKRSRWREREVERPVDEQDRRGGGGVKMDLRELLAGGGSITEIRASEVLIIKPSAGPEEMSAAGGGGGGGEAKSSGRDYGEREKEVRHPGEGGRDSLDPGWLRDEDRETLKEKERSRGQATVGTGDWRDGADAVGERGNRVSQLLSKFGEHHKLTFRSKSSDNFLQFLRNKDSAVSDEDSAEEREANGKYAAFRGVPRRSFSFCDRAVCVKENGVLDGEHRGDRKVFERTHSDRKGVSWVEVSEKESSRNVGTPKLKVGFAQPFSKDLSVKHVNGQNKIAGKPEEHTSAERAAMLDSSKRKEMEAPTSVRKMAETLTAEKEVAGGATGEEGFTTASVRSTEGVSFARRVPIRHEGRARGLQKEARPCREDNERPPERETRQGQRERECRMESEAGLGRGDDATETPKLLGHASVDPAGVPRSEQGDDQTAASFTERSDPLHKLADGGPPGPHLTRSALSQHTEGLISQMEQVSETSLHGGERAEKSSRGGHKIDAEYTLSCHAGTGMVPSPLEIQIPRTVFYVANDAAESGRQSGDGRDSSTDGGAERRNSWRIGKPLSRVESLREKIRQRERERERSGLEEREVRNAASRDGEEASDRRANGGEDANREQAEMCSAAAEGGEEVVEAQTSAAPLDVTQEVSAYENSPQLPVSLPFSSAVAVEEVTRTAVTDDYSDTSQLSEEEDDLSKHVEEEVGSHCSWQGEHKNSEEEREVEGQLSQEGDHTCPDSSTESLTPSPPHLDPLAEMSRIYNLKTVESRTGLSPSVHLVKVSPCIPHLVKVSPCISQTAQTSFGQELRGGVTTRQNKAIPNEHVSGVRALQLQLEKFQLKEQEVGRSAQDGHTSPNTLKCNEPRDQLTPRPSPKTAEPSQAACSPTLQLRDTRGGPSRTVTITPGFLRSPSPESSPWKPSESAPTPASSPNSCSPDQSPSTSPSPLRSSTSALFSIRSASGGQVKRGATITINPKKTVGGGAAVTPPAAAEAGKKRFPTVEEIVVIGGYQNLERSCLVKCRGTPKRVKVCFDEGQLEQVCEYPSETSLLAAHLRDAARDDGVEEEVVQEREEEEERRAESTECVGSGFGRVLNVGQCHQLRQKPTV